MASRVRITANGDSSDMPGTTGILMIRNMGEYSIMPSGTLGVATEIAVWMRRLGGGDSEWIKAIDPHSAEGDQLVWTADSLKSFRSLGNLEYKFVTTDYSGSSDVLISRVTGAM